MCTVTLEPEYVRANFRLLSHNSLFLRIFKADVGVASRQLVATCLILSVTLFALTPGFFLKINILNPQ